MSWIEILNTVIGVVIILVGITGFGMERQKNRLIARLLGTTGYRIFTVAAGVFILYMTWFTDYFAV